MSLDIWRANIFDEIPKILNEEPSEKRALLLSALYDLQERFSCESEQTYTIPNKTEDDGKYVSFAQYAEEELNDADKYFRIDLFDIARDELRHAQYFIDKLRKEAYTPDQKGHIRDLQIRHDLMLQDANKE